MITDLALKAVQRVTIELPGGRKEIDTKLYARVEKMPGEWWSPSSWSRPGRAPRRGSPSSCASRAVVVFPPGAAAGGELSECRVLDGVMVEKDVTHPRMKRRIENPRIILLDSTLEYKKAETAANLEVRKADMLQRQQQQQRHASTLTSRRWAAQACRHVHVHPASRLVLRPPACRWARRRTSRPS